MSEAQVEGIPGSWSEEKPADAQIQRLCDETKTQFEKMCGERFLKYKAIVYISQVVAGMMYIVKVQISDATNDCLLEKIFQPLNGRPEAVTIVKDKTLRDPITLF